MRGIHIITPVKDSIDLTLQTAEAVVASALTVPHDYTLYNDFSTPENTAILTREAARLCIRLVNLSDLTEHPSPNYLLVLQTAQAESLRDDWGLLIVESDVTVTPNTLQGLYDGATEHDDCGIAAAVTVDEEGRINYPYLFARGLEGRDVAVDKHCSFCCSLLTTRLLRAVDFHRLDADKNWHDVTVSHRSLQAGLRNYLYASLPVVHHPHGSRPWKQLKYTNPLKYYWLKLTQHRDKI